MAIGLTAVWLALVSYQVFYLNYQEFRLSWLVYRTVSGRSGSWREAAADEDCDVRADAVECLYFPGRQ